MKRDKILTLAKQAGMAGLATTVVCEISELERFVELVSAEEREECAKVAASYRMIGAGTIANAIRERSNVRVEGPP